MCDALRLGGQVRYAAGGRIEGVLYCRAELAGQHQEGQGYKDRDESDDAGIFPETLSCLRTLAA